MGRNSSSNLSAKERNQMITTTTIIDRWTEDDHQLTIYDRGDGPDDFYFAIQDHPGHEERDISKDFEALCRRIKYLAMKCQVAEDALKALGF